MGEVAREASNKIRAGAAISPSSGGGHAPVPHAAPARAPAAAPPPAAGGGGGGAAPGAHP